MKAPRIVLVLALVAAVPVARAAPAPAACSAKPDIRNLMSVSEYTKSGLDKLSQKELDQLNAWLVNYTNTLCGKHSTARSAANGTTPAGTSAGAGQADQSSSFGKTEEDSNTTDRIVSHINGVFHGWTGNTRFHLANGQIWVQAGPGYYETTIKNPKVVIKKLLIGYILEVNSKEVFVRRIR